MGDDVPKMVSKLALERKGRGKGQSCLPTEAERCTCCSEEQMTESLWSEVARMRTGEHVCLPHPEAGYPAPSGEQAPSAGSPPVPLC